MIGTGQAMITLAAGKKPSRDEGKDVEIDAEKWKVRLAGKQGLPVILIVVTDAGKEKALLPEIRGPGAILIVGIDTEIGVRKGIIGKGGEGNEDIPGKDVRRTVLLLHGIIMEVPGKAGIPWITTKRRVILITRKINIAGPETLSPMMTTTISKMKKGMMRTIITKGKKVGMTTITKRMKVGMKNIMKMDMKMSTKTNMKTNMKMNMKMNIKMNMKTNMKMNMKTNMKMNMMMKMIITYERRSADRENYL